MKNFIALIFLIMGSALNAQIISVQGNVKSANDGEPLIGVNVVVQGDAVGTITDFDGNYTLNAPLNGTLVFSYIGYDDQVIKVENRKTINVELKESSLLLDEIIAVGYRTERKADLTGAVSIVKVDDMMSESENNPMKALQGRIPGMQVSADGNPSGAATIRIRGIGTLNNNDPLYKIGRAHV